MAKRYARSAEINRDPILAVLRDLLPATGLILEVASGTGQHAVHFARHLPGITWQPSEVTPEGFGSIEAWRDEAQLPNVQAPLLLDVLQPVWPLSAADAVFCSNMIHIAPWSATEALLRGAARVLSPGSPLILYGPFLREGVETSPGNLAFDTQLRAQDPSWGVRSLDEVLRVAEPLKLRLDRIIEMPSNNSTVRLLREAG
jgi:SAM-dependent methyltransferase